MKIMILDDHIAVGEGTRAILQANLNCQAEVFTDPYTALHHLTGTLYDVYLIDFNLPDMDGFHFLEQLFEIHPDAIAIIYTGYNIEKYIADLLDKGISGFISKTDGRKQLIDTVLYATEGKIIVPITLLKRFNLHNSSIKGYSNLTERECKILELVKGGFTNKAIALELGLNQRTIEKDLTVIFTKLSVKSRAEAAIKWHESIIQSDSL